MTVVNWNFAMTTLGASENLTRNTEQPKHISDNRPWDQWGSAQFWVLGRDRLHVTFGWPSPKLFLPWPPLRMKSRPVKHQNENQATWLHTSHSTNSTRRWFPRKNAQHTGAYLWLRYTCQPRKSPASACWVRNALVKEIITDSWCMFSVPQTEQ